MDTLQVLREECNRALDFQMKWVDALDTKPGLILGAVSVVSGVIFSGGFMTPCILGIILIVSLVVCFGSSLACVYVRSYRYPPNPDVLRSEYYAEELSTVRRALIATAADAWLINQSLIQRKAQWLKVAIVCLAAALVIIIASGLR